MEVVATTNGTTTTLAPTGWLDSHTAPDFAAALNAIDPSCEQLVFDFANVEYISSAGLRIFVAAHRKMKGNFKLVNASSEVMQVLSMARFDKRLHIE